MLENVFEEFYFFWSNLTKYTSVSSLFTKILRVRWWYSGCILYESASLNLSSSTSDPVSCGKDGRSQIMIPLLSTLHGYWRPKWDYRLLVSTWPNSGCCRHLGSGTTYGFNLSVSFFFSLLSLSIPWPFNSIHFK